MRQFPYIWTHIYMCEHNWWNCASLLTDWHICASASSVWKCIFTTWFKRVRTRSSYSGLEGFFFNICLFYIAQRTGQGLYQLLTMVDAGGTRTCVHSPALPLCYEPRQNLCIGDIVFLQAVCVDAGATGNIPETYICATASNVWKFISQRF